VPEQMRRRWFGWFAQILLFALVVWMIATAVLAIPHGEGHSIESTMAPVQTVSNIAFPIWLGSLVGMIGLLAVGAFEALDRSADRHSS
jgi:hypothetical protein